MRENTYGSLKRLDWIRSFLRPGDRALEVGCGTGWMITLPLLEQGVDIRGVDLDRPSVEFGKKLLAERGGDPRRLRVEDLRKTKGLFDVVVVSEVLEHLDDKTRSALLRAARARLTKNGYLLVTVPNGRGWFEAESALWKRLRLAALVETIGLDRVMVKLRRWTGCFDPDQYVPSTLSSGPHVQRFSYGSIERVLEEAGFEVVAKTGSVLAAGPLSHLLASGFTPLMALNGFLGAAFPSLASGFFVACHPRGKG